MNIVIDTHTHTILSGHAYSTWYENLMFAGKKGLYGIVTADHASQMPGGFIDFIFDKLADLPEWVDGVRSYKGMEANIMDYEGHIDVREKHMRVPELMMVSLHDVCLPQGTKEQHTSALIGALRIPEADVAAHPGNPYFEIDQEAVVKEAKKLNKIIEVNNHSFSGRAGSEENCREIIKLCKKHEVRITVASDAHCCTEIGHLDHAIALLEELHFPEELVINSTVERFEAYQKERKERLDVL